MTGERCLHIQITSYVIVILSPTAFRLPPSRHLSDIILADLHVLSSKNRFFLLTITYIHTYTINTKFISGTRNRHICGFFMPVSWPFGLLNGIRLLVISRNCPGTREGRALLMSVVTVSAFFICRNTKIIRRCFMTPQTTAGRPEFPVYSDFPQTENLNFHTQQAEGRAKTDYRDVVDKVIAKLSMLDDLFSFYWIARGQTDFQKDSLDGLSFIISDCVNELKEINN